MRSQVGTVAAAPTQPQLYLVLRSWSRISIQSRTALGRASRIAMIAKDIVIVRSLPRARFRLAPVRARKRPTTS